jgi:FMN phosphatase YigB (HAD superfamily)
MPFKGVLFDWRGTLFHDVDDAEWVRSAAVSIGRDLPSEEVARLNKAIEAAAGDPEVIAAQERYDASVEAHRAGGLLHFRRAGLDEELALAVYERDGALDVSVPYPDTGPVLRRLKELGVRIAIVSDIHFDLRPFFVAHGIDDCIEAYALSYQHGWVKPDAAAFRTALDMIGLQPAEVLMVGDRAARDGGAAAVGITTIILPPVPNYAVRGLDLVVRFFE